MPLAATAVMDADNNQQEYGTLQVDIYGRPGGLPGSWSRSSAQLAAGAEVTVVDSLYSAGGGIDGGRIRVQDAAPVKR